MFLQFTLAQSEFSTNLWREMTGDHALVSRAFVVWEVRLCCCFEDNISSETNSMTSFKNRDTEYKQFDGLEMSVFIDTRLNVH